MNNHIIFIYIYKNNVIRSFIIIVMKILSFDIGVKNLAYCLINSDNDRR